MTKVPGIGKKGAERIVLELKDKVGLITSTAAAATDESWRTQVQEALVGLGWSTKDADAAIDRVATDVGPNPDVSLLLREALRSMDRTR